MKRSLVVLAMVGCGGANHPRPDDDTLAARFSLARLDDHALCDQLLARSETDYAVTIDREPRIRRKVIVSDLHLGAGTKDPRFAGIEDFFADAEWAAFLDRQAAAGPTDLIINGDFIDFWQLAAAMGALPKPSDRAQPRSGPVLATDQTFALTAVDLVIDAHRSVFTELGRWIARGDNRVIIIAGNHDADLLWPKVQLAIARAIARPGGAASDSSRLMFVDGGAYEHAGVHVEHGHAYDLANRFASNHAPFGRDRDGRCRLQSSWGAVFVAHFYSETERQIPFIDNLYPESAAILWAFHDDPQPEHELGAAIRFLELIRSTQTKQLNRDAAGAIVQSLLGAPGAHDRAPESLGEVLDHVVDELAHGDPGGESLVNALLQLRYDPQLASLWQAVRRAAVALPDFSAALSALSSVDPDALGHLRDVMFGDTMETAARRILASGAGLSIVVFGHTHEIGGSLHRIAAHGHTGYYVNSGSWLSVASVADLRGRGITWQQLSIADRTMFPSKTTAVIIEYDGSQPRTPVVWNAR